MSMGILEVGGAIEPGFCSASVRNGFGTGIVSFEGLAAPAADSCWVELAICVSWCCLRLAAYWRAFDRGPTSAANLKSVHAPDAFPRV
jgi:hypothetical protein